MNDEQPKKIEGERRETPAQAGGYSARRFPRKDSNARGPRSAVNRSANRANFRNGTRPQTQGAPVAGGTNTPRP
ncbi:MAG: hypothetical protein WAZ40_02250, partial [Minisyncoccia bacterium]